MRGEKSCRQTVFLLTWPVRLWTFFVASYVVLSLESYGFILKVQVLKPNQIMGSSVLFEFVKILICFLAITRYCLSRTRSLLMCVLSWFIILLMTWKVSHTLNAALMPAHKLACKEQANLCCPLDTVSFPFDLVCLLE